MKIYDRDLTGASAAGAGKTQETQKTGRDGAGASRSGSASTGDRVEFSSGLNTLSKALNSFGVDRNARVESLAALYQAGKYQASSMETGRAMISEAMAAGASA